MIPVITAKTKNILVGELRKYYLHCMALVYSLLGQAKNVLALPCNNPTTNHIISIEIRVILNHLPFEGTRLAACQ